MNSDIKLSVIIPAYNVATWLPRCVESVINQTYRNLEILIIDDGSTDETSQIADEYAEKDNRIRAIHQENAGLVSVREVGIELSTGQYVGFIDGDDEIASDMYERLINNALKYDAEISQCGILYCFYDGRKKMMHGTGELSILDTIEGYKQLLDGSKMEPSLCNKIYAKHLLKNSCLDKSIVNNEDLLRNSVLFARAKRSVFEDFCGYHYWRRADSMSNNERVMQTNESVLRARKIILDNAEACVRQDAWKCYMAAVIAAYNVTIGNKNEEVVAFRKKCRGILKEQKKQLRYLNKRLYYRAIAVLTIPCLYGIVYKIHIKLLYARIHKEAKARES